MQMKRHSNAKDSPERGVVFWKLTNKTMGGHIFYHYDKITENLSWIKFENRPILMKNVVTMSNLR